MSITHGLPYVATAAAVEGKSAEHEREVLVAENAESFLAPVKLESGAKESYVRFDPMGIIFAIMPWNFPYWQVIRMVAPTLAAGNAVLIPCPISQRPQ